MGFHTKKLAVQNCKSIKLHKKRMLINCYMNLIFNK